jgi:radical SAM protein with 4Fe4S-binding SPASM domain
LSVENLQLFLNRINDVRPGNKIISLTLDGEPTLNKSLPEFIKLINERQMFPRLSSNAKILTPTLVNKMASGGSFLIQIDFASDSKYFDNIRGKEGDFNIILENLRYLVEVAKKNKNIHIEIINISHFSGADPEETLNRMRKLFPNNLPRNISSWSREFHNFCGHLKTHKRNSYVLCPYPWTAFTVTWNGDVVPCCRDTLARTVLGNVFSQTIPEIWHGESYKLLRKKLIQQEVGSIESCKNCDLPWSSETSRWKLRYIISSLLRR